MRDRFPLLLAGALVFLGVIGAFIVKGARRGAFADVMSTYRSEKDGARALYLFLEQSGANVARTQKDFSTIEPGLNLAILGSGFRAEHDFDTRPLFGAKDGGVDEDDELSEEDRQDLRTRGLNALRSPPIGKEETDKLLEHIRNGATVIYVPWGFRENALLHAVDVGLIKAEKRLELRTIVPSQVSPYTEGVERLEANVQAFLDLPAGAVPLLVDEKLDEPVGALIKYGQGRLVVLSSPELAMNLSLARADNAQLWRSLARTASKDGVLAFDEYHHGFTSERSLAEFAARYGLQFAGLQLLLGVVLWAVSLRRLGRPRAVAEELRVGSTDALFATSRLYREGRHHAHAAASIARELAAEMALKAGVAGRTAPTDVSAALDVRGRKDLADSLLSVTRAAAAAGSEADVLMVARLAATARYRLHQRTTKRTRP